MSVKGKQRVVPQVLYTDVCKGGGRPPSSLRRRSRRRERRQIPPRAASLISPHLPDRPRNITMNNQSATALQFKYKVTGEDCGTVLAVNKEEKGQERR